MLTYFLAYSVSIATTYSLLNQTHIYTLTQDALTTSVLASHILPYHYGVYTTYPARFRPDWSGTRTRLSDWLPLVPREIQNQKMSDTYLIVPTIGVIVPIDVLSGMDEKNIDDASIQKKLLNGLIAHDGISPPWISQTGVNRVIGGHTSYLTKTSSIYTTVMQFLPLLSRGDEMWIVRTKGNRIKYYIYTVQKSSIVRPDDISIFYQSTKISMLSLYGCYPFGSIDRRWIVQSRLSRTFVQKKSQKD